MSLNQQHAAYAANQHLQLPKVTVELDREALVQSHLPQVKFIAERIASKLPPSVDTDDLYSAGVLGLLDAIDRFDPTRGVMFKTYAEMRVRGAILDSLRDLDWVPRSVRRRAREVEAAYLQIEQEKRRPAEDSEVAKKLGMTLQAFHLLLTELRGLTITCLDHDDDDDSSRSKQLAQDSNNTPLSHYERAEVRDRLAGAIDQLPERERQVVALYYIEELTMKEIGLVLGVTESRVSQLHTQAVLRLRSKLSYMKAAMSHN